MSATTQTSVTETTNVVSVRDRRIARAAWWTAWFGLVIGQLHALARFRTEDGKSDLDLPLTGVWARPAEDLFSPLLDWASPDAVYTTYGKLWLVVFVGFTAMAFVAYRHRRPVGFEKWAWRVALCAYVGACVSVVADVLERIDPEDHQQHRADTDQPDQARDPPGQRVAAQRRDQDPRRRLVDGRPDPRR